jgi:hypothetical protein
MEILGVLTALAALLAVPFVLAAVVLKVLFVLVLLPFKLAIGLVKGAVGLVFGLLGGLFGLAAGGLGLLVGLFVLRRTRPNAERPYRAFGYPLVPALYILVATGILGVLLLYKTQTTWPGLVIVLAGITAYFLWRSRYASPEALASV